MYAGLTIILSVLLMIPVQGYSAPVGAKHFGDPKPAPGFVLTDLNSDTHKLTDYRGKVLIVSFWATWCLPCIRELPSMARAADLLHEDDVHILAINVGENAEDIKRFLARTPIDFVLLPDEASKVAAAWDVRALPTAFVVDKHGRVAMRVTGGLDWDTESMLQDLRNIAGQ